MASTKTKTKKKKRTAPVNRIAAHLNGHAGNGHANGNGNGAAKPKEEIDLLSIDEAMDKALNKIYGHGSPLQAQKEKVEKLESQLKREREKLEFLARPLKKLLAVATSDQVAKLAEAQPYDAGLRACIAKLKLTDGDYDYKTHKKVQKPTGAKAWKTLQKEGATDEQIATNLKHVNTGYYQHSSGAGHKFYPHNFSLTKLRDGGYSYGPSDEVLKGRDQLVKAVRRVMGIGQPIKPAAAPKATPAKKKPAAKKAASRKKKPVAKQKSSTAAAAPSKNKGAKAGEKSSANDKSSKHVCDPVLGNGPEDLCELHGGSSVAAKQRHQRGNKKITRFPQLAMRDAISSVWSANGTSRVDLDELCGTLTDEVAADLRRDIEKFPADYPFDADGFMPEALELYLEGMAADAKLAGKDIRRDIEGDDAAADAPIAGEIPLDSPNVTDYLRTPLVTYRDGPDALNQRSHHRVNVDKLLEQMTVDQQLLWAKKVDEFPKDEEDELYCGPVEAWLREIGFQRAGGVSALPSPIAGGATVADVDKIFAELKPMPAAILKAVWAKYPANVSRNEAAKAAGYKPGGKVAAAFNELIAKGYITKSGRSDVAGSEKYCEEAAS